MLVPTGIVTVNTCDKVWETLYLFFRGRKAQRQAVPEFRVEKANARPDNCIAFVSLDGTLTVLIPLKDYSATYVRNGSYVICWCCPVNATRRS
jgi:hypothetical protein